MYQQNPTHSHRIPRFYAIILALTLLAIVVLVVLGVSAVNSQPSSPNNQKQAVFAESRTLLTPTVYPTSHSSKEPNEWSPVSNDLRPITLLYFPELRPAKRLATSSISLNLAAKWLPRCNFTVSESNPNSTSILMESDQMKLLKSWRNERDFNLIFIKIQKVGGSTVSGVVRGIAAKYNLEGVHSQIWIAEEPGTRSMYFEGMTWCNESHSNSSCKLENLKITFLMLKVFGRVTRKCAFSSH